MVVVKGMTLESHGLSSEPTLPLKAAPCPMMGYPLARTLFHIPLTLMFAHHACALSYGHVLGLRPRAEICPFSAGIISGEMETIRVGKSTPPRKGVVNELKVLRTVSGTQ